MAPVDQRPISLEKKILTRRFQQTTRWLKQRRYRRALIISGVSIAVLSAFNFWMIEHTEDAFEKLVSIQSQGKVQLTVKKLRFNWFKNRIELNHAIFSSADQMHDANTIYELQSEKISIEPRNFFPFLFGNQFLIDSIHLQSPNVLFTRIRKKPKPEASNLKSDSAGATSEPEFSVAREMGRMSKSIIDAISVLKIDRLVVDNGSFALVDYTRPHETPFRVSRINIKLDNLQVDSLSTKRSRKKIPFADNIAVQTSEQQITFPGGRHFLSFKNFTVNLLKKRVEFDSCMLQSVKGDSSKTAFRIFFDKLRFTDIDFNTLYQSEVINADSVYCANPKIQFDIDADRESATANKTETQRIDNLIQQLFGDIMLKNVVVHDADVQITTLKKGRQNRFSADHTNFELQNLVVRQHQERPVSIDKFYMTLHNYETTLQNGKYKLAFDSIHFLDNALNLSNFTFGKFNGRTPVASLKMKGFQVRGLSWEGLLYDNVFKAKEALFRQPIIHYNLEKSSSGRYKSIFGYLGELGGVMDIGKLTIREGDISLDLGNGALLRLENADMSILPYRLMTSKKIQNIRNSFTELTFGRGTYSKESTLVELRDVKMDDAKKGILARGLSLHGADLNAEAGEIRINDIMLDSIDHALIMEGLSWDKAIFSFDFLPAGNLKKSSGKKDLFLTNISGRNTSFIFRPGDKTITGDIDNITVDQIAWSPNTRPEFNNLQFQGKNFVLADSLQTLSLSNLTLSDKNPSVLKGIEYKRFSKNDSLEIRIPTVSFRPDINRYIRKGLYFENTVISDPEFTAVFGFANDLARKPSKIFSGIHLEDALLERPVIQLTLLKPNLPPDLLFWNGRKASGFVRIKGLSISPDTTISVRQMTMHMSDLDYFHGRGLPSATRNNELNLEFQDLMIHRDENNQLKWRTTANLFSPGIIGLGTPANPGRVLRLDNGEVRNIRLNSGNIHNLRAIIYESPQLWISRLNGNLNSKRDKINWYGLNFRNRDLRMDSFHLVPFQSLKDYRRSKAFDEDYLEIKTGEVRGNPVQLTEGAGGGTLQIEKLAIDSLQLLSFKDKTQAAAPKIKPLPAQLIRRIPLKLWIDSLQISNGTAEYQELDQKYDGPLVIPVSGINGLLTGLKNSEVHPGDSLRILARGDVLNQLPVVLWVKESYTDSLRGFLMDLDAGPAEPAAFNIVVRPLTGVEIHSGRLNKLALKATGNNNFSEGIMNLYYDGLKIRLLNKDNLLYRGFKNKLGTMIANTFIIRRNADGRESPVYFERQKERSAIHFLYKTALSGIKPGIMRVRGKSVQMKNAEKTSK